MYQLLRTFLMGLFLSVCVLPVALLAQDATGTVAGVITDATGSVVSGAKVSVTNTGTNISRVTTTDNSGYYQATHLPVGQYVVTAEALGFSQLESTASALDINQTLRVDLQLQIGQVTDTVTVDAAASTVETENSTLGGTVTGQAIFELPLNGRNTLSLLGTQSGITPANPDNRANGGAGDYSIGGGRADSVTYLLDGALNNNLINNSVVVNPNPDAVAEFRVLESNYGAEYGRNAGGIVSIVTKSGTNSVHGTLYDYLRNDALNANEFFSNEQGLPRPVLKRNQFGGTIGGPLSIPRIFDGRNRLFFFFSYQGQRQNSLDTSAGKVNTFTPAEANGDFSQADPYNQSLVASFLQAHPYYQSNPQLASQGIIDPTRIDPVAQAYFKAGLIPTSPSGFIFPRASAKDNNDEYLGKFDLVATNRDSLSGTFTARSATIGSPFGGNTNVTGLGTSNDSQTYSGSLNFTHTFTPSLLNELRFSAVRYAATNYVPDGKPPVPSALGINITPDDPTGPALLNFYGNNLNIGLDPHGPTLGANTVYSLYDNLSWTKGRHSLKFGFFFSPYQNNTNYDFYVDGNFSFYGPYGMGSGVDFADFLMGLPDNYYQSPRAPSNIRTKSYAGYVQDQWKLTKRFTLTLGVRYEYAQPKYDTQGRTFSFIPGAQSTRFSNAPLGLVFPGDKGAPTGSNFPDKNDWAPRFGFAWDVFGNAKTSIRGGFGIFYDVLKGEDNLQFNGQPPFFSSSSINFSTPDDTQSGPTGYLSNPYAGTVNPFPSRPPASNIDFAASGLLPFGNGIFLVDPHLRTPYVYQYNLNLQQQLPAGMVLELGYLGSDSHKLTSLVDINPFPLGSDTRIYNTSPDNSLYYFLLEFQNLSKANYNAMEANLTKRFSNSILGNTFFTFAYTWGHEIDNASGFRQRNSQVPYYNHDQFRASGDTDVRQYFSLSGGWELPFDRIWQRGPKLLTKGWSLYPIVTWRTGFPIDVPANLNSDNVTPGPAGDGQPLLVRADLVGKNVQTYNPRQYQNINGSGGNYYFNPANFSNTRAEVLNYLSQVDPSQLVGQFTYGSFPRNGINGPGLINADLAISKHFLLFGEKLDAELRGDAFNVFNHANFLTPDTFITSPTFGQISTTVSTLGPGESSRIIQVALHLKF